MTTKFGEAVRKARRANNIKQEELAERIGMERSYLSKRESGKVVNPEPETRERIAAGLGLTPNEILAYAGTSVMEEETWYRPDVDSNELLQLFNRLGDDDRDRLVAIARVFYQLQKATQ